MTNQIVSLFFVEDYETLKLKLKSVMGRDLFPNEFAYIINPDTNFFSEKSFFLTNEKGAEKSLQNLKQKIIFLISDNNLVFNLFSMNYDSPRVPQRRIIVGQQIQPPAIVVTPKAFIPTIKFKLNLK